MIFDDFLWKINVKNMKKKETKQEEAKEIINDNEKNTKHNLNA